MSSGDGDDDDDSHKKTGQWEFYDYQAHAGAVRARKMSPIFLFVSLLVRGGVRPKWPEQA